MIGPRTDVHNVRSVRLAVAPAGRSTLASIAASISSRSRGSEVGVRTVNSYATTILTVCAVIFVACSVPMSYTVLQDPFYVVSNLLERKALFIVHLCEIELRASLRNARPFPDWFREVGSAAVYSVFVYPH